MRNSGWPFKFRLLKIVKSLLSIQYSPVKFQGTCPNQFCTIFEYMSFESSVLCAVLNVRKYFESKSTQEFIVVQRLKLLHPLSLI